MPIGHNPDNSNHLLKKTFGGSLVSARDLSKGYKQNLLDNNKTFKEEKKTNILWGGGAKDSH